MRFEITADVIEEAGHSSAMLGISFNKDQDINNMPKVALRLAPHDGGHNKFLEQIIIWMVVRAPRYWWQEADTFRLSSKSSQSTMHTILKNTLVPANFECNDVQWVNVEYLNSLIEQQELVILKRKLPEGFMQKRMWMMSYKTLRNLILQRRSHRLPHWKKFISDILSQVKNPELLPELSEKIGPSLATNQAKKRQGAVQNTDNQHTQEAISACKWKCERCGATFDEYVNGCPKCEVGADTASVR